MAQVQQETITADPATQAFIADRQIFWNRFTSFTTARDRGRRPVYRDVAVPRLRR